MDADGRLPDASDDELVHCFTYIGSAAGGNFGLRQEAKEEHIRYVTTERRGISPKVSRPRGLKRRS
jgi:hypothetical protein